MVINKNGNIKVDDIYESEAMNVLEGDCYTSKNPYILSGKGVDIYKTLEMYGRVIPGKTYCFIAKCNRQWASNHYASYNDITFQKATMFLYFKKEYVGNSDLDKFDAAVNFNSSTNMIDDGVWEYTIPNGFNQATVRINTYSDGENAISTKFWDIALVPKEYYIPPKGKEMSISNNNICVRDVIEI